MIRTTVVGSWPPARKYRKQLQRFFRSELLLQEAEDLLQEAAREAILQQRKCGLSEYTGGETSADTFILHYPKFFSGLKVVNPEAWEGRGSFHISGKVEGRNGLGIAQAFRREHKIDSQITKMTIPGPSEITMLIEPEVERRRIWPYVTTLIRKEIHDCIKAGANDVQLDMPHAAIALADHQDGWNPDLVITMIRDIFEGVGGVRRSVHFCYGDFGAQSWARNRAFRPLLPVIQQLEGTIDRVVLELSLPEQWAERHLLADIPENMEIAAGILDVKSSEIETIEEIQEKIRELIRYIPAERLLICPSCGFGRRTTEVAIRKVTVMVKAVQLYNSH